MLTINGSQMGSGKMKAAFWCVAGGRKEAVFMNYVGVDVHKKYKRAVCAG